MEFNIENSDLEFRTAKVSPVELLAITSQIDFNNYKQTKELFTFALEHVEVKQCEKWFPVKTKDREVYAPLGIEENYQLLQSVISYYVDNVIIKAFQNSSE